MRNWVHLLIASVAAILLAVLATTTPFPAPADAPAADFSAGRAMADVREIAKAPHPTGSPENARVRAYLTQRLQSLGMTVTSAAGPIAAKAQARLDKWRGSSEPTQATNLIATLPGRDPAKPAVLLMAHHDTVWGSPGAADDTAGVAAILEIVRAIRASGQQPERTLIVLLTDGEELGLDGAHQFFERAPTRANVGVIVNLETRGGGGRASMFETGEANGGMIDLFAGAVSRPVGTSLSVFVYKKLPNSTDYTVAKKLGVAGFNFAFIGRPGLYHSPLATPDALDQGSLQDMGRQVLDLSRALLAVAELPRAAPDRVFYDLFGLVFVAYAAWVGWLFVAGAVLAYGYAGWGGATRDLAIGAGVSLLVLLNAGLLLYCGNLVSGSGGVTNYYDRLAAIPRLELQAVLLCLATALPILGLPVKRGALPAMLTGMAAPFLILAVVAQALAPTAAFPLYLPLLLGGIGAAAARWRGGLWVSAIAAALGVGYMLTLGHALFQAVGPGTPFAVLLPLGLSLVLLVPLVPAIAQPRGIRTAALLAAACSVAALGIALWVNLDPLAPSVAVYSSDH